MAGKWMKREGSNISFLADSPEDFNKVEAAFKKNHSDPTIAGRTKLDGEPDGAETKPDFVGRLKSWMLNDMSQAVAGRELNPAVKAAGEAVFPDSITGAVTQAAIGSAGALAKTGSGLLNAGIRIATPAVAGGVSGALTGGSEGAKQGALAGGVAGTIGEVGGLIPAGLKSFYEKFGHFKTANFNAAVSNKLGPKLATAIAEDIPSLGSATTMAGTRDIDLLTTPEGGKRVVGKMFDKTEGQVVQALQGQKVPMPFGALMLLGKAGANSTASGVSPNATVNVTPAEGIRIIKELRATIARGKQDALAQPSRELYDKATEGLMSTLQASDPQLYSKYTSLRDDYKKFVDFTDFVRGNNTEFLPTRKGGQPTIDLGKMYESMRNENSTIDPNRFSNLWGFFEGGSQSGPIAAGKGGAGPRLSGGGIAGRAASSIPIPGRVGLPTHMEDTLGTTAKLSKTAGRARSAIGAASVPTIEQMIMNANQNANEPLPSELLKR